MSDDNNTNEVNEPVRYERFDPDHEKHVMVGSEDGRYVRFEDFNAVVDRILAAVSSIDLSPEQHDKFVQFVNGS